MRWLGLRVPALYKDEDWEVPKRQLDTATSWRRTGDRVVAPQENRALAACAAFRGDVLIVESEHDDVVPHPVIANYLAAFDARPLADLPGDRGRRPRAVRGGLAAGLRQLVVAWMTEMRLAAKAEEKGRGRSSRRSATRPGPARMLERSSAMR